MNYLEESSLTMSENFYPEKVGKESFKLISLELIHYGNILDQMKKSFFYGKDNNELIDTSGPIEAGNVDPDSLTGSVDIVHGIIGCVTESLELLSALNHSLTTGEPIDKVNLFEEVGDLLWYQAAILRVLNKTFAECEQVNIDKLRSRYGEKFSEYDALNRNLDAERDILETGLS